MLRSPPRLASIRIAGLLPTTLAVISALSAAAHAQFCDPWFGCFGGDGVVDVSVTTVQQSYIVGDPIIYSVIASNPAHTPVTLHFTTSRQADYIVDGVYSPDDIGLQVLTSRQVPALGSVSWDFLHPWDLRALSPGSHSVAGEVVGYGASAPATFSVSAPAPVTDDVRIDFEHYPNGTPTHDDDQLTYGLWRDAFIRDGVHFRSQGGSVNLTMNNDGGAMLHAPRTSYPPGFNIVAEFDMPVFGVSADVGSAADHTITMFAYDSFGHSLGSVTSDPVSNYPNLIGPLSFDSPVPIASVQWYSSSQNAAVRIDNLLLNVDLAETHGDYNADGHTDLADYTLWRNSLGAAVPIGSGADGNHDGHVDEADYALWRTHFGWNKTTASLDFTESPVPEPSTAALLAALAMIVSACDRARTAAGAPNRHNSQAFLPA